MTAVPWGRAVTRPLSLRRCGKGTSVPVKHRLGKIKQNFVSPRSTNKEESSLTYHLLLVQVIGRDGIHLPGKGDPLLADWLT